MKDKLRLGKRSATLALTFLVAMIAMLTAVFAAGETIHFGVDGYSSGSNWNISAGKSLVVEANGLSTSAGGYRIRITLAKGMQPKSFIWNNNDSTNWPKEIKVQGSALDMDNAALDFFDGGSASVDSNGNTVLEYRVTGGVSRINLTDKIIVVPNGNLVYTNDEITNAIKIELLDKDGSQISGQSKSVDVKIVGDKITNYSYTAKKFLPGQGEGTTDGVHLYDVSYSRRWTGTFVAPMPVGKVDVTLGLPNCVSGITQVIDNRTGHGTKIDPSNIVFSETNHTVTIKNYEIGADEKDDSVELSIYGTISSSAATGTYKADPTVTVFKFNNLYDEGTATYDYSNLTNLSTYAVKITQSQSTIQFNASQASSLPQFPEGHYGPLGRSGGFFTSSAQSAQQNLTWTFDDRLQVIGVYFPTETGSVNVTSVTLSNGQTYNLKEPITIDGAYQNLIYVNVADLHSKNSSIRENCFIKSITANCGNFSAGFAATSWYGKPIGRFVTGIEAGGAQTIPFSLSVNDIYTEEMSVIYDPTMDVACTNIEDTLYSDAARTKNATSFRAGSIIYGSTRIGVGGNALIPTKEPRFYIVVPQDMYFDPTLVTAHDWVTTTNSARSIREPWECSVADGGIKYNSGYVQDAEGNYYTCYEFYIPDTVISSFQNVAKSDYNGYGHSWYGGYHTSLIFDYQLEIADTAITKNLSIGDYLMVGKGNIKTRSFSSLCGINGTSTHVDTWDMDDNGNRSETSVAAAQTASITILDNMNITVSGYLTQSGGGGVVNPYDPGADGSNEVNVVEFMPNTNADYHVVISNTLVSIGEKCAVNAYIPIPKGTVNGTEFTAKNITAGPAGSSRLYQFNDFQWPMSLRATIGNVDPNNFEILYYLDSVTVNNDGKPSGNTTLNPSDDELERTVLVEIRSKSNVKVPSGQFEFTVPLKVGVNETDATTANLNDKKNIFRPRYYREGGIGDLWVNGNYVAARLGASSIGGYVFHDYNGNGIWDKDLSESAITDLQDVVEIQLYSGDELLATTTPNAEGKYSFTGADLTSGKIGAGTYKIKFVRNNSMYVFTKNHAPTQNNYQTNSEAVASGDNSFAEATITLPYEGILSGYQEFINAGLFQDSIGGGADGWSPDGIPDGCEARVDYMVDGNLGTLSKTFEYYYAEDGTGGYEHTNLLSIDLEPPTITWDANYETDYWECLMASAEQNPSNDGRFHFDECGDPGTRISVTVYGRLQGSYYIRYHENANGDTVNNMVGDQVKKKGETITLTTTTLQAEMRDGYLFGSWNTEQDGSGDTYFLGSPYSKDEDIDLYAQWIERPAGTDYIIFRHNYLNPVNTSQADQVIHTTHVYVPEEKIEVPLLELEGYSARKNEVRYESSTGYYEYSLDGDKYYLQTNFSGFSFQIKYERTKYILKLDGNGGYINDTFEYRELYTPNGADPKYFLDRFGFDYSNPNRAGYEFVGWEPSIPEKMPTNNVTVFAQWRPIPHTIIFKDYDGTEISRITGEEGSAVIAPAIKNNRTGYRMVGWDTDVPDSMPDEDMTITAVYEPIEYTIRYTLNGGEVMGNPTKYTIESNEIRLNNPSKPGYTFDGWTGTGLSGTSTEVTIPTGSMGNREYTANWPESATYIVKHYKANLDGNFPDDNNPTEIEERSGTIGEMSGAVGKSYTGFVAKPIEQQIIKDSTNPSNKTVVKVYYDRKSYTFTWYDEDGNTELGSTSVVYGADIPTYSGEPNKTATAEYTYTFDGWISNPAIVPAKVEGDVTYTATYKSTKNKYKVSFVDDDGATVLKEATEYEYGTLAKDIAKPADPTKASTAEYTYAFVGWTPEINDVTSNVTYKAIYTSTKNKYKVSFVDEDGTTVLKEATEYEYGTLAMDIVKPAEPTKDADAQYTYTFAGWDPEVADVKDDATYKAKYTKTINKYTITFVNDDGTVLQTSDVEYGSTPSYTGATPTKKADSQNTYTFAGWTPSITEVTGEAIYTARFTEATNQYTVKWLDEDGKTVLDTQTLDYGSDMPTYKGAEPTKAATAEYTYAFDKWVPDAEPVDDKVTRDITFTASYTSEKNKYLIKFLDEDGTVLQTSDVEYGSTPTYVGTTPTKNADAQHTYTFAGWAPSIAEVSGEATYTATFTEATNQYTVKWLDEDGKTVLDSQTLDYGSDMPSYKGAEPTKAATAEYTYAFDKWVPDAEPVGDKVTRDITFTASYTSEKNKYLIKFLDEDGTVLQSEEVPYGTTPSYGGKVPTKPDDEASIYEFAGWDPEIKTVDGEAEYKALFNKKPKPTEPKPIEIEYYYTLGENSSWTQEDGKGASFRVSRNVDDASTFTHFQGIDVDGEPVSQDSYTAESGSVKIALNPDYIDSLIVGEHTITAKFDDGKAETKFYVKTADTNNEDNKEDNKEDKPSDSGDDKEKEDESLLSEGPGPDGSGDDSPEEETTGKTGSAGVKTGDNSNLITAIAMLFTSAIALAGLLARKRRS